MGRSEVVSGLCAMQQFPKRRRSARPDQHHPDAKDRPARGTDRLQAVSARPERIDAERRRSGDDRRRDGDGTSRLQCVSSRVPFIERHRRHGARRRHRGAGQFLDPSAADRLPEDLPQDHRRSSLRDGAGRRRKAGGRHCHSARTSDQSGPRRGQARQASHLRLRLRRLPQALWRPLACRNQEPPAGDSACAPGRRFRLCQGFGIDVAGRHRRHQDQFQHRRALCDRTRGGNGFSADIAGGAGGGPGCRRPRRPPPRRSLAGLSQGVSQLGPAQDRHRLAQENLRSQDLSLLQGRLHSPQRSHPADGRIEGELRAGGIFRGQSVEGRGQRL